MHQGEPAEPGKGRQFFQVHRIPVALAQAFHGQPDGRGAALTDGGPGFFFGMGLIAACDTLLDHAKPAPYTAQVVAKHTSSGRSTTYYLDFGAWGPFKGANTVSVPNSVYQAAEPGDTVCFEVYPGALRAAWFERVACDGPTGLQTTP